MNRDLVQAAIELARLGLRPVPTIAARKQPALKGWRERASCDPQKVANLFTDAPHADALAIATGDGVFVIDLDRNHDGADGVQSFAALIAERAEGQALAPGPRVRTPRGGVHLYFRCDGARAVRNRVALAPGVDVRGIGGLAMAPPSARYAWFAACEPWARDLPQAPAWLLRLIDPPKPPSVAACAPRPFTGGAHPYARVALERELKAVASAAPGTRNNALNRAAYAMGRLCAAGALPADAVANALLEAAEHSGLIGEDGEAAARATIASGLRGGRAKPRQPPPPKRRGPFSNGQKWGRANEC